eukprot:13237968-Alexandrium_andersonii.AAC.1
MTRQYLKETLVGLHFPGSGTKTEQLERLEKIFREMGRCQHLRMGWHGGKTASYRKCLGCGQRFEQYERT